MTTQKQKLENIKRIANNALYFDDWSDFATALWEILEELEYTEEQMNELKFIEARYTTDL